MLNFINFPLIRFRKSQLNKEFLNKFFIADEIENMNWRDSIIDAIVSDDVSKANSLISAAGANVTLDNYILRDIFSKFTLDGADIDIIKQNLLSTIKDFPEFSQNPKVDENIISIESKNGPVVVAKLTSCFPAFRREFPNIGKEERSGNCHAYAYRTALGWDSSIPLKVATGYIYPFTNKDIILHSWLEIVDEGKAFVLDPSRNLLMNKDAYYINNGIAGPVYKISQKTIKKDKDIILDMSKNHFELTKLYFSNRHQALALYNKLKKEDKVKLESDPIYKSAEALSEAFKRKEKQINQSERGD